MARDRWFQPPRHVLILFVAVTVVPAAGLVWLSWQLLKQDRALESQRLQERLDHAADLIGAALDRQLTEAVDRLPALGEPGTDAFAVTCLPHGIEVNPRERLLYYPVVPPAREPRPGAFEAGEAFEFRQQDHAAAIAEFRRLAGAADPTVRGGALVRLGRNLRKAGRQEEALEAYERLAQLGSTSVSGVPAELLAGEARLAVLQTLGRMAEVEGTARALSADLQRGRWILDRATFEFHSQEVERRLAVRPERAAERQAALALAAAVESLWGQWQAIRRSDERPRGRRTVWVEGRSVLIAWTSAPDKMTALVAGPAHVDAQFCRTWQGLGVTVALVDADSHGVRGGSFTAGQPQAVRAMADTGLPWTLRVASANPVADLAELAGRRRLLLAGLAMMGVVVIAGTYFTARAVTRELAVARLQSDFVSAVSHEFRTPLTSMRHLTELLDRGVVSEEDRRKQYYAALSHETTRLHRLVESLLNFGRMEAGALEYCFETVSIAELVEEVVAEFERDVCAGDSRIELATPGPMPEVRADREALGRAVWNLLDNAVKYSPGGTTVRVDLARDGGQVFIHVRDEGAGIPADERKQIFKKFVRGAQARASHVKGTGIGLAMVQHIVRAHRGAIRLDSQPGKGSTFSIVLPVEGHAP
jgi:signal transduction histidine kinase/tetratricopeptide (TPR) repeat protein